MNADEVVRMYVGVSARYHWRLPPKDDAERLMREQADVGLSVIASRISPLVQLMMSEILAASTFAAPQASSNGGHTTGDSVRPQPAVAAP